jgi:dTMP kinase
VNADTGRFIVIEGADGSGKSTQALRLIESMRSAGLAVQHVRDPGSTRLAETLRRVLLDHSLGDISPEAETLLYLAARAQLAAEVIGPALKAGTSVVCERWNLSTEVYQGHAGKFGVDRVRSLCRLVASAVEPDVVIVLDVKGVRGLVGAKVDPNSARQAVLFPEAFRDRMESKNARFQNDVVRGFRRLARSRRRHVIIPPGHMDEVARKVLDEVVRVVR